MKQSFKISILMAIAIISNSNLFAATKTWNGNSNTSFSTNGNWVGGAAPVAGDDVIIPAGLTNYPVVGRSLFLCNEFSRCLDSHQVISFASILSSSICS